MIKVSQSHAMMMERKEDSTKSLYSILYSFIASTKPQGQTAEERDGEVGNNG